MSGRQDSNLRPPAPKAGAITGLRYAPKFYDLPDFDGTEYGSRFDRDLCPERHFNKIKSPSFDAYLKLYAKFRHIRFKIGYQIYVFMS